jgi:hypothetical protein
MDLHQLSSWYDSESGDFFEFRKGIFLSGRGSPPPATFSLTNNLFLDWIAWKIAERLIQKNLTVSWTLRNSSSPISFTPNALDPENDMSRLVLIQGSRSPITGIWSLNACTFHSIDKGTVIPWIKVATNRHSKKNVNDHWHVIVINPNHEDAGKIPAFSSGEIMMNLFTDYFFQKYLNYIEAPFYIVTHGLAADSLRYAMEGDVQWAERNIKAIAMGDGFLLPSGNDKVNEIFAERTINWIQSEKPLNEIENDDSVIPRRRSAGVRDHSLIMENIRDSVFEFFDSKE